MRELASTLGGWLNLAERLGDGQWAGTEAGQWDDADGIGDPWAEEIGDGSGSGMFGVN